MLGSVFSPYYAWRRARARHHLDPLDHCALNVALYGRTKRWAMTERGRRALHQERDRLVIGPSQVRWDGGALLIDIDEIGAPIPRRIRGQVRVEPRAINPESFALDAAGHHSWWPIAPLARVEVELNQPRLSWSGSGYLDSNRGDEPLEDAFQRWNWSRAKVAEEAVILYDVTARPGGRDTALALRINQQGQVERFELPPRQGLPQSPVWRVARGTQCEPGAEARVVETLEDTPFYARSVVETQLLGQRATCVHESLCLDRFSSAWVRVLLPFRMPRVGR